VKKLDLEIVIVGAGMSGLLMGIRLQKAGYSNFRILEKASSVGGTWRENTYPGLSCDVPSFFYSYSFETNLDWSHRFAPGPEIRSYFERVAEKYDLNRSISFDTEITNAVHTGSEWRIETRSGEKSRADILILATGPLHHKHFPEIEGLESFAGKCFHTAAWDHEVPLEGQRIGMIGTGATAAQATTPLAEMASHLTIFQRTPQWIFPIGNKAYSDRERGLKRRFPFLASITRAYYKRIFELSSSAVTRPGFFRRRLSKGCRDHLETVSDPELRRKLTPDYEPGCKRLVMSRDFYPSVQRENVHLETNGIERIEPRGVVTHDGKLHELDVLVLATGFHPHAWGIDHVTGDRGLSLKQAWQQGTRTYRSVAMPGFPNLFMLAGPNCPLGNISVIDVSETVAEYVLGCLDRFIQDDIQTLTPSEEATRRFNESLVQAMDSTIWTTGCDSWYLGEDGIPGLWPWTAGRFHTEMKRPDFADYDLIRTTSPTS
jgi:cation diffusion facilitator CzcD-associated flavoprotein CzcO